MQRCVVQILHSSNVTFATLNDDSSHPKRLQKRPIFHHTGAAASSTRQHYPGHAGRVAILCALARAAQRYSAHRAYRKHGSSPCASRLIQCEWCNNSQLHEGGKHGVGSNTTGVVPRWRRRRRRRRHSVQWRQPSAKLASDGHKNTRGPHPFV